MRVQYKIFLVIFPLILVTLATTGFISALATRAGLTQISIRTQSLKAFQLEQHMTEQWSILKTNNIDLTTETTEAQAYSTIFEKGTANFAANLLRSPSEIIFAVDKKNQVLSSTYPDFIKTEDAVKIRDYITSLVDKNPKLVRKWLDNRLIINNKKYIGYFFSFKPLDWYVFALESYDTFFSSVRSIINTTLVAIAISLLLSVIILFFFTQALMDPVKKLIRSMHNIIRTNQLKERVPVVYNDEIGELSHTFNITVSKLEEADKQIRNFAFHSVLAKKQETKVRNIFQKYVPKSIIDTLFKNPSRMLVGENKELSVLFSDIRGFTTISESYSPDALVAQLNIYFEKAVNTITQNHGVIDKYIGDAIMAFFGAPAPIKNSALAAVQSAMQMQLAIKEFNKELSAQKKPEFITGIGISYGSVTVGNIGSEKKMDYTVIGDVVNLGSRLEGLTKHYHQDIIFSSSVCNKIRHIIPCRLLDIVQVKGKTSGEHIYTTVSHFNSKIIDCFSLNNEAIDLYFKRNFTKAILIFERVLKIFPNDFIAAMHIERCNNFIKNPPPEAWDGIFIATTK